MHGKFNSKLKKLADASALIHSVIPVLICDENLLLCTKSAGAERLFKDIAPKHSVADRFTADAIRTLESNRIKAFLSEFECGGTYSPAVIIKGCVSDEKYIAVIFRSGQSFYGSIPRKYIRETLTAVSDTLFSLLSGKADNPAELKYRCMQLSRICSIYSTSKESSISISDFMESFASSCEWALSLFGMSVRRSFEKNIPLAADIPWELLRMIGATLVMSLLSIPTVGEVELGCTVHETGDTATIHVSTDSSDGRLSNIKDFDSLCAASAPMSFELTALKAVAPKKGIALDCSDSDGKLTVHCRIPVCPIRSADMHAPKPSSLIFTDLLRDMYDYIASRM